MRRKPPGQWVPTGWRQRSRNPARPARRRCKRTGAIALGAGWWSQTVQDLGSELAGRGWLISVFKARSCGISARRIRVPRTARYDRRCRLTVRRRWGVIGAAILAFIVGYCVWLVFTDAAGYRFLVRLYHDRHFLKQTLRQWGILAPLLFISLQALQVIIAPIPGEVTGILGGYVFGEWTGLIYSTVGLTAGSVVTFGVGRWLGGHYVRSLGSPETW